MLIASVGTLHAQDFEPATEAVKNMGVGWNLGNTLVLNCLQKEKTIERGSGGSNVTIKKAVVEGTIVAGITPLVIDRPVDNTYYNLKGQRVTHPQKGIYIQNGKKIVFK